jgi:hypothetical protein
MNEQWIDVVGYEGLYMISDLGRIKRLPRVVHQPDGKQYQIYEKVLSPGAGKSKYLSIRLTNGDIVSTVYIHQIVLCAFVGPCPEGMQACHCDGDRQNNKASNLRWDTIKANHADKRMHGTSNCGDRHPFSKLNTDAVIALRKRRSEGASITTLANEFSVSRMTASRAASSKSWSHV